MKAGKTMFCDMNKLIHFSYSVEGSIHILTTKPCLTLYSSNINNTFHMLIMERPRYIVSLYNKMSIISYTYQLAKLCCGLPF